MLKVTLIAILTVFICIVRASDWWEHGSFYQIYPRSFKDSNGDGIGDLNGIIEKLPYLKELGITGIWLSPIFPSPMYDSGYDISDYTHIHPDYGTMRDFESLIAKCNESAIKLIVNLVPNHSSVEHEWFQKSVEGDPDYKDFYVWHPGRLNQNGSQLPPNNWLNIHGGSAWTWNDQRKEFYLHQFTYRQPDLNFRNVQVQHKMEEVVEFWLNKGVSGIRLDAISHLFEQIDFPDEPLSGECVDPAKYCYLNHMHTTHLNETFNLVYRWRKLMDDYKKKNGGETRILLLEVYAEKEIMSRYYDIIGNNGGQIPINFELLHNFKENHTARDLKKIIDACLYLPEGYQNNWILGNHDQPRIPTRLGPNRIDIFNILLQTLPGISFTYYGEEIGMANGYVSWTETTDPVACNTNQIVYQNYSRDPARTPFQWDATSMAGFSNAIRTWLPVNTEYTRVNVQAQRNNKKSHLKVFKDLIALRNDIALTEGRFESFALSDEIFTYKRQAKGFIPYVIVLNLGKVTRNLDLKSVYGFLPDRLRVVLASIESRHNKMDILNAQNIQSEPNTGLILTYP